MLSLSTGFLWFRRTKKPGVTVKDWVFIIWWKFIRLNNIYAYDRIKYDPYAEDWVLLDLIENDGQ